ncbi:MAG TPA: hypothetical protein VKQ32_28775 [Polyangia bacterium]|nr:hypothetical protein [Polyangia bacterium]
MKRGAIVAALIVAAALLSNVSCSRSDSLVLLDLRRSGPLGEPVARVRLSASGWPTRTVTGDIGADGFQVGYYGPGKGAAVTVTAEALDAVDCVLGSGSATVAKLSAGATSDPVTLFIRPLPANGCVPDAGMMDAGDDAGDDGGGTDAGMDAVTDGMDATPDGTDGNDDTAGDAATDVGADSAADAMGDAADDGGDDGATPDTSVD